MKILIYGDPHITKKIQEFQNEWNESILTTFTEMYDVALSNGVEFAICTGDFFDKDIIEAKSVPLVNNVRTIMSKLPTYLLLGNHEIDSNDNNILDALGDDKFIPVTSMKSVNDILFIPYTVDLDTLNKEAFKDKVIITHHDIYGSVLAGGKVKASFGYDPNMFNDAKIVFNGHIHLRSKLGKVFNTGSLFSTQFGELDENSFDHPMYYIYDTESGDITYYVNNNSLHYVTCDVSKVETVTSHYSNTNVILRVSYLNNSDVEVLSLPENVMKVSKRKIISNNPIESTDIVKNSVNIDIKDMISSYITKDNNVPEEDKSRLIGKCLDIIGG